MYLVELGSNGLINIEGDMDGFRAISSFRDILDDNDLGLPCLTAISLVADHLTPIRYYTERDRPLKAMWIVTNDRRAFEWNQEKIQRALLDYESLQYNPVLEQKELLLQMQMDKITEVKKERDGDNKVELFKQLGTIKGLIDNFNKEYADVDPYADGPVVNGYSLSRLEEKLTDVRSFYHTRNSRNKDKKKVKKG